MSAESFSGLSLGLASIVSLASSEDKVMVELDWNEALPSCASLSLDGIPATVKEKNETKIIAEIATATLRALSDQFLSVKKVSLSVPSSNPDHYPLQAFPIGTVKLIGRNIAEGHQHIEEFTFEADTNLIERIRTASYIGLNASALTPKTISDKKFTIHVGRQTKEKTMFGSPDLKLLTEFNLSLASK